MARSSQPSWSKSIRPVPNHEPRPGGGGQAGRDGGGAEDGPAAGLNSAAVAEQSRYRAGEPAGVAEIAAAARFTAGDRWVVIEVVDHDQVEPAVAVVIEEGA